MVLIKQLTIVLFAKTTDKHALISPGFDCYYQDSFSSLGQDEGILHLPCANQHRESRI